MSHISAKIIADTINPVCEEARITTFEVCAPRFLLAEVNTHGVIARSAASSRAIPVSKRIAMTLDKPYEPDVFGKNQPGMSASEQLSDKDQELAISIWRMAMHSAVSYQAMLDKLGVHKQHANRVAENFTYYTGVMTATEWDNFWRLRMQGAQPEFEELATKMFQEYTKKEKLRESATHLPYVDHEGTFTSFDDVTNAYRVSAARCARVSYKTFDGKMSTVEADLELCEKLTKEQHLSPFDHPAVADDLQGNRWANPTLHRRFWGWVPYRVGLEQNLGITTRRDSFGEVKT